MKYIFLNLKRFDIPPELGGVNRLAPTPKWGWAVVTGVQEKLCPLVKECRFPIFFPEAHILGANAALMPDSPVELGCQGVFRQDTAVGGNFGAFTTGRTAHAARPQAGDNAIKKLLRFLSTLEGLGESDRAICAFAADTIEDCYGEHLGIAFTDEPSGRLTCISGLAHTEEGRLVMGYNIRYSVTHKGELVTAGLEKAFAPGWELRSISDSVPMYLPADDPKVKELCRIYHEVTGKDATPYVIGGGTYARHLQNAVGFGMETDTPTGLPEGHGKAHEPDEAVIIDELLDAIKIYILSILEVDELLHR